MSRSRTTLRSTPWPLSVMSRITRRTWSLVKPILAKSSTTFSMLTFMLWFCNDAGAARGGGGGPPCGPGGYPGPAPPGGPGYCGRRCGGGGAT